MLLTGILLQIFGKLVILLNYEINKEYIAKNLCENRSKPTLNCKGHCQLKKQLEKEEKNEQAPPFANNKEKYEMQYCYVNKPFFISQPFTGKVVHAEYLFFQISFPSNPVFHPPDSSV